MKKVSLFFAVVCCALLTVTGGYEPVSADTNTGTVTDIDGNVYKTVKIGNQVWMAENLRTTKYNDGTSIPLVTTQEGWAELETPAYCYYSNTTNIDNIKKYGALYNWHSVDTKKLAPKGWHVPSMEEWDILQNYLIANGYNWDGTKKGNKIAKSMASKTDWEISKTSGTIGNDLTKNNKSGFTGFPGGFRKANPLYDDYFIDIGIAGSWWSNTPSDDLIAMYCKLTYDYADLYFDGNLLNCGLSVRLVKNN